MFAVEADGVDFWGEAENAGLEKHRSLGPLESKPQNGAGRAGFSQELDWVDPRSDKTILLEHRRIAAILCRKSNPH